MATVSYSWNPDLDFFNKVINTTTAGDQGAPDITALADGRFAAIWNDPQDGGNVLGRIYSAEGVLDPFTSFLGGAGAQFNASIAGLPAGGFVFAYVDTATDPGGDIRRFSLPPPNFVGGPVADSDADDVDPDIAALPDGGFVVTWTRGASDVMRKVFNGDLSVRAEEAAVDGGTNGVQPQGSSVTALTGGGFVVAFHELYSPINLFPQRVLFRRYDSNGNALDAIPAIIDDTGFSNRGIHVLGLQDGGFVVTYTDTEYSQGTDIRVRIYNADGSQRIDLGRINNFTAGDQDKPMLALLSNGFFVVGWQNQGGLKLQAFDPNGNEIGAEYQDAFSSMIDAAIAGLGNGRLVNVRSSTASDGSGNSIRAQASDLIRTTTGDTTNEVLVGDSLIDLMTGGGGNDTLDGGGGIDSAFFSGVRSAYKITALPGNRLQVFGPDGTDTLTNVERLVFDDQTVSWPSSNGILSNFGLTGDFNGDGKGDLLWRGQTGEVVVWQTGGASPSLGVVSAAWSINGTGDFDGDGRSDLLWRNQNGEVVSWETGGPSTSFGIVSFDWHVQSTGDFDGDGQSDILWRKNDGEIQIWEMANGQQESSKNLGTISTAWHIEETGDFNGDRQTDILWRHDSGLTQAWIVNNGLPHSSIDYGIVSNAWKIQATGDFDGDGRSDILWRNQSGEVVSWQANGTATSFGVISNAWHIEGTGDFNGDRQSDILWHKNDGEVQIWEIGNGQWIGSIDLTGVTPTWGIIVHSNHDII